MQRFVSNCRLHISSLEYQLSPFITSFNLSCQSFLSNEQCWLPYFICPSLKADVLKIIYSRGKFFVCFLFCSFWLTEVRGNFDVCIANIILQHKLKFWSILKFILKIDIQISQGSNLRHEFYPLPHGIWSKVNGNSYKPTIFEPVNSPYYVNKWNTYIILIIAT